MENTELHTHPNGRKVNGNRDSNKLKWNLGRKKRFYRARYKDAFALSGGLLFSVTAVVISGIRETTEGR